MSTLIFPVIDRAHPDREPAIGHMCSHCGHMPFDEVRCPNGCPLGSLDDEHLGVITVLTPDVRSALRGHVTPARIEQLERRMLGYDVG
jgi:hypothetical protein